MKPNQSIDASARTVAPWVLSAVAALVLTACASSAGISPAAQPLAPAQLGLAASASPVGEQVPSAWWKAWGDPALDSLVEQALAANPSLQTAEARLVRARAAVDAEGGQAGPQLQLNADTTRQHFSANSIYPSPLGGSTRTLANVQLAGSWELDFFGRHRAAIAAAVGGERAAQADLAAARNLLVGQVAQTYVQLARLQAQRSVAERALAQREQMLTLIRQRVDAGLDTQVELRQGEGALPETRQSMEQLDEQITQARHALAALAAVPMQSLTALRPALADGRLSAVPASVSVDLLGARPDVTAARWRIEAATQGIAAAKAQFYPNVSLTAFAGLSSIGLDNLVEAGSRHAGVGPAIHLPILDAGLLRANLRGKTADLDSAVAAYNGAVLNAVRDAADQVHALQSLTRQRAEQAQAQRAAEEAYGFARQRYGAGLSGYLTLLNAESAVLAQRRQAVDLQARTMAAQAGLIQALGGGFQAEPPSNKGVAQASVQASR